MKPIKSLIPREIKSLLYDLYTSRKLERDVPVFVFQMGKVASTSVYKSLFSQYPGLVAHAHIFSPEDESVRIRRLYEWTVEQGRAVNVISPIREPIGRNISAFFQNIENFVGVPFTRSSHTTEELLQLFLEKYPHQVPLNWFDKNILPNFSIDVYDTPFPEEGYSTYCHGNVRLMVLRSDLSDKKKSGLIGDFVGLDGFSLKNANFSSAKNYSKAYQEFKNTAKLPPDYIEKMRRSKYFNHFFSGQEINAVCSRWRRN